MYVINIFEVHTIIIIIIMMRGIYESNLEYEKKFSNNLY